MGANKKASVKYVYGFKKACEEHAIKFREQLGIFPYDHLPARTLAEHLKIPILSPRDIPGLSKKDLSILLKSGNKTYWSAATIEHDNGDKFILLNDSHSDPRQESDIMHELAHVIRGHEMSVLDNRDDFPLTLREYNDANEEEAIWFGGVLQIPREGLVWAAKKNLNADKIAEHFKASKPMATFRINKEGIRHQFKNYIP